MIDLDIDEFEAFKAEYEQDWINDPSNQFIIDNHKILLKNRLSRQEFQVIIKRLQTRAKTFMEFSPSYSDIRQVLGCNYKQLANHLGEKSNPTDNIDHIIPCSYFNLNNIEEFKISFHFTNLRWLSDSENKKRKDNLIEEDKILYFNNLERYNCNWTEYISKIINKRVIKDQ